MKRLMFALSLALGLHAASTLAFADSQRACEEGQQCVLPAETGKALANSRVRPRSMPPNTEAADSQALPSARVGLSFNSNVRDHIASYHLGLQGGDVPLDRLRLVINLPADIRYLSGSSVVNNQAITDPEVRGSVLVYSLGDVPGNWQRELNFIAEVGAGGKTAELPATAFLIFDSPAQQGQHSPIVENRLERLVREADLLEDEGMHFNSFSTRLSSTDRQALAQLADQLQGHKVIRIEATGHTDNLPIHARSQAQFADNLALSAARARSVASYLARQLNLPESAINAHGLGATRPYAPNHTAADRARNRRVDLRIVTETIVDAEELGNIPSGDNIHVQVTGEWQPVPDGPCNGIQTEPLPAFRISVDGEPLADAGPRTPADAQRCSDVALARAEIRISYDGGEQTPWLNVHATPQGATQGERIDFVAYSNYAHWIERAEIRLFTTEQSSQQQPYEILPVEPGVATAWVVPAAGRDTFHYLLRVYDAQGRFDETRLKPLTLTRTGFTQEQVNGDPLLAGYGENSLAMHNIPVRGGAVTASGEQISPGEQVLFMGMPVPVDAQGRFAARQILPAGPHRVDVMVLRAQGGASRFSRNLTIADEQWFYVGLADLTAGRNVTSGPVSLVTTDDSDRYADKLYVDGRLAFYLKGKIKGEYLLTAAADTREQPIEDLFSNFSSKDPRYLLRRLDAERYYPVYGDDSTTIEDAPTQGKFFVKLERGESQIMWGNFQTSITGSELVQYNRGLYGARVKLVSDEVTQYGENRGWLEGFVADPGSLPGRDEFRGTGGSLYYLQRQDVTQGSERVWIEIRDRDSGLVLETRNLMPVQDYDVNYLQGRILLRDPLSSIVDSGGLVRVGSFAGHPAFLVVTYEYTPGVTEIDDLVKGGRAGYWVNDHVGVGVTAYQQDSLGTEQTLQGVDITLRATPDTYLKLESARSDDSGSGSNLSQDGGFNFNGAVSPGGKADAHRIEAGVNLAELHEDAKGRATLYWQDREAGYSAPGQITGSEDITQQGAAVEWLVNDSTELRLKADDVDNSTRESTTAEVDVRKQLDDHWAIAAGVRTDDQQVTTATASPTLNEEGRRTDVIIKGEYQPAAPEDDQPDWSAYAYIQGTADKSATRSDNNRVGVGGTRQLSQRMTVSGELSGGNGGLGMLASGDYTLDDQSSLYLNYQLDTDRTDTGYRGRQGQFTSGARRRFSDALSIYGEERFMHGEGPSGLTHAYGLDLAPNDEWTWGLKLEAGELSDPLAGDMRRRAGGVSAGYHHDGVKYAGNLEYRREKATAGKRATWLMRNTLGYQLDPDRRLLGRLNLSMSDSSQGNFYDGDYVELVSGYAYRPIDNNRLNTLLKYTYFYTLPPPQQLTGSDILADYAQRSHVLSADGIYDVLPWLSVGGKYGLRLGQMKDTRMGGDWLDSFAHLFVVRADLHWVHEWDFLVEARLLDVRAAEDRRAGALLGLYRHVTDNFKLGGGYNFTDFSDDLTDLSYDHRGWFINLIGKL